MPPALVSILVNMYLSAKVVSVYLNLSRLDSAIKDALVECSLRQVRQGSHSSLFQYYFLQVKLD